MGALGFLRPLLLLFMLILAGCTTELYAGLPEQEANEMLGILLSHGVSADKVESKDGTVTLSVEKSEFAQAVALLSNAGYPRRQFETMGDVFKSSGLVASPLQERARFIWALGQELSATVADIDGVLSARVQVVLPENDLLARDPTPSSASVFVRYDQRSSVAHLVPQIKMLVANSVQGLSYDKVSVVLVPATTYAIGPVKSEAASAGRSLLPALGGAALAGLLGAGWAGRRRLGVALRSSAAGDVAE